MKKIIDGVFLRANVVNSNGRMYSTEAVRDMQRQFEKMEVTMYGQLGYPELGEISSKNISHRVLSMKVEIKRVPRKKKKVMKKAGTYLTWKKNNCTLRGKIEILDTPGGKEASNMIDDLVARPIGIGAVGEDGQVQAYELISVSLVPKSEDSYKGLI